MTGSGGTGPNQVQARAWVYVVNASTNIHMGTGNGGSTTNDVSSTTTGTWEQLITSNGGAPFNEIIFHADRCSAEFYVGFAEVIVPEPFASILPAFGLMATALFSCRR